jgi:AMP phosphorylase
MKTLTLKLKPLDMETGRNIVVLHEDDAEMLGHIAGDRVKVKTSKATVTMIANTTRRMVQRGELGSFIEATESLGIRKDEEVEVTLAPRPLSTAAIRKKLAGEELRPEEIGNIVRDIVSDNLTTTEMTAFVTGCHTRGMTMDEIVAMTKHMVETGDRLELEVEPILDVHSIGGVPGNKYALITVPIIAAAGLTIPKTSSRAITSAAGTADVMEVLTNVTLTLDEIAETVKKVGGVLAWGGAVRLAPADDAIIRVERMLGVDPRCQLLASVMAKKLAVGADKIVIDIPAGPGAKVEEVEEARKLAHDFIDLAYRLGVQLETAVTYGGQPIGYAVGPALEAQEALKTLMGNGPGSLVEKSTSLAGLLLELGGITPVGTGKQTAREILTSGKAYRKMREIIEAQGGDPDIKPEELPVGGKREVVPSPVSGYIKRIYNQRINEIARTAGAPKDKGAGVRILLKEGRKVEKGDPLLEIFAEHEARLDEALLFVKRNPPIKIEGMLLERISHAPRLG